MRHCDSTRPVHQFSVSQFVILSYPEVGDQMGHPQLSCLRARRCSLGYISHIGGRISGAKMHTSSSLRDGRVGKKDMISYHLLLGLKSVWVVSIFSPTPMPLFFTC